VSDWLLDTLLATSALALLVLLIREPVRRRFGSRVTYALWLIPAARLFMPTLTRTVERTIPAESVQPLAASPLREAIWMARVTPVDATVIDRLGGWAAILLTVWAGIAAALFLSRIVAFYRDRRAILASAVGSVRLGSVRVVRTPEVLSPVAVGIFDRIIAVPSDFDRRYSERERQLVLEHELEHHRSGDLIANLFAFVLLCLQWFNPLAWVAHAAFRFDQEAACDARVLDKANTHDRADYGRAIAKAASGRALLFASALDRRNRLHRRLQSMLSSPNPARQLLGRAMVITLIVAALPLTASRSTQYVEARSPARSPAPPAPAAQATVPTADPAIHVGSAPAPMTAVQPAPPSTAVAPDASAATDIDGTVINGDLITIDGKTKRWEELTSAEQAKVRSAVARARAALAKVHLDRDRIMRAVNDVPSSARMDEIMRDVARAQDGAAQAMQKVDVEKLKGQLAKIDPEKIKASLAAAERAMQAAQAGLDRLDARIRDDKDR
jgi:bla regulator protein blaR1